MRAFLNAILTFISCSTLTDVEWDSLDLNDQSYTLENYTALLGILTDRDSVSTARDRLTHYFQAAGLSISAADSGKSDIFIGAAL